MKLNNPNKLNEITNQIEVAIYASLCNGMIVISAACVDPIITGDKLRINGIITCEIQSGHCIAENVAITATISSNGTVACNSLIIKII